MAEVAAVMTALGGIVLPGEMRGDLRAAQAVTHGGGDGPDARLAAAVVAIRTGHPARALAVLDALAESADLPDPTRTLVYAHRALAATLAWSVLAGGGSNLDNACSAHRMVTADVTALHRAGLVAAAAADPRLRLVHAVGMYAFWQAEFDGALTSAAIPVPLFARRAAELGEDYTWPQTMTSRWTGVRDLAEDVAAASASQGADAAEALAVAAYADRAIAQIAFRTGAADAFDLLRAARDRAERRGDRLGVAACLLREASWLLAPFGGADVLDMGISRAGTGAQAGARIDAYELTRTGQPTEAAAAPQSARELVDQADRLLRAGDAGTSCALATVQLHYSYLAFAAEDAAGQAVHAGAARQLFAAASDAYGEHLAMVHQMAAAIEAGAPGADPGDVAAICAWGSGDGSFSFAYGLGLLLERLGRHWRVRRADPRRARAAYAAAAQIFAGLGADRDQAQVWLESAETAATVGLGHDELTGYERVADALLTHAARDAYGGLAERADAAGLVLTAHAAALRYDDPRLLETVARIARKCGPEHLDEQLPGLAVDFGMATGRDLRRRGDPEAAYRCFREVLGLLGGSTEPLALLRAASAHLQLRDHRSARRVYAAYLRATRRGWLPRLVVRTLARLGPAGGELVRKYAYARHYHAARLAAAVREFPAAQRHLADAERLGGPQWWRHESDPWQVRATVARVRAGLGDPAGAAAEYAAATDLFEAARTAAGDDVERIAIGDDPQLIAVFVDAAAHAVRGGHLPADEAARTAFDLLERARGRAVLDLVGEQRRLRAQPPEAAGLVRRLRQLRAVRDALVRSGQPVDEQQSAIDAAERALYAVAPDLVSAAAPVLASAEVQRLLPPGTAVVCFVEAEQDVLLVALTATTQFAACVPCGWDRLPHLLARWTASCADPQAVVDVAAEAELGRLILDPLAAVLDAVNSVIFIPQGLGLQAPLHALPFRAGRLIDAVAVSYLPTASIMPHLLEPRRDTPRRATLVVGNPVAMAAPDGTAMPPLPYTAWEARLVHRHRPGGHLLTGEQATRQEVLAALPDAAVVHLATHGAATAHDPADAAIMLAHRENLSVVDLLATGSGADLVVLSACLSGVGPVTAGGEVLGFARALIGDGARSVVSALWPAIELPAQRIMDRLYEGIPEQGVGQALAAAQRAVARMSFGEQLVEQRDARDAVLGRPPRSGHTPTVAGPDMSHPAYWAPFIHWGLPGSRVAPPAGLSPAPDRP
ncbi:hypothetical protein Cs7R123_08060 [Catellatospora sp. TT07R-123]|uniref:CHAT domain-containing protein n=1 Tax=Catellatospora sp. TT07R-123 TaxID=2733863 RepID=UPI001B2D419F|nr:CHAT domain-containing protein [Catellatospora sp. TT07R-123]GHJ43464.1 hypothetical protein Cs7R123_08060 [Catellatospora sp. TT07R-123]